MTFYTAVAALAEGALETVLPFIGRDDSSIGGVIRAVNRLLNGRGVINPGVALSLVHTAANAWSAARAFDAMGLPTLSQIPTLFQTPESLDDPIGESTFHYKYIIKIPIAGGFARIPAIWETTDPWSKADIEAYLETFFASGYGDRYIGGLEARLAPTGPPEYIPISLYEIDN